MLAEGAYGQEGNTEDVCSSVTMEGGVSAEKLQARGEVVCTLSSLSHMTAFSSKKKISSVLRGCVRPVC